jgi:phage baseplate assembly protein W
MAYQIKNINPLDLQPSTGIGVSLPFSSKSVFNTVYTTQDQLKYNIINYLLTDRSERVFNTNFGASLRKLLFENINNDSIANIEASVRSSLEINFPNININQIYITSQPDNNQINIYLTYNIVNTGIVDEVNINLQNG